MKSYFLLVVNLLVSVQYYTASISVSSSSDIRIVGLPGGAPQILPAQYVKSFQRWSISKNNDDESSDSDSDSNSDEPSWTLVGLPGASSDLEGSDSGGFVDPTSTDELWWPVDIQKLQVRSTLDVILQRGSPAYVAGGMHVRVPPEVSANGAEWRNYGLSSQPLARQWTTFGFAVEPNFRVETFLGRGSSSEPDWEYLSTFDAIPKEKSNNSGSSKCMRNAIETLGIFLSGLDETSPLSQGFHVLSIPVDKGWIDLPALDQEPYALVSLATAEPDAKELLTMDSDIVTMTATSILAVEVSQTEAGGKSDYLPEAYRPLYKK